MNLYLGNAFSLQMLDLSKVNNIAVEPISKHEVKRLINKYKNNFKSIVGHQDTANVLTDMLGIEVSYNRESVKLNMQDMLIVAQVTGGRLPEGATTLPEGVNIVFSLVYLL